MMPDCRAESTDKSDKGPNALAEKGEQMKEDAREHIEDMVSLLVQGSPVQSS